MEESTVKGVGGFIQESPVTQEEKPIIPEEPRAPGEKRKLAILGTAASTINLAPYNDMNWEIWGLGWRQHPRANRLFDLHRFTNRKSVPVDYWKMLEECKIPIYMQRVHPEVPQSIEYPLDEIITRFGPAVLGEFASGDYFASSFAYMMCMAINEGYKHVGVWGFDMLDDSEYAYQRPNAEYLIGIARGMGMTVYLPETCAMCKFDERYGYMDDESNHIGVFARGLLEERIKKYSNTHAQKVAEMHVTQGMLEEVKQLTFLINQYKKGGKYHLR